jgi:hypothetical protein
VHISAKIQPTDHMSTPVEYCRPPRRISGDRYHRVTTCTTLDKTLGLVQQARYLVSVCTQWDTEGAGQTEIGQLEIAVLVNQKVLWLQVTVQHATRVAVLDTLTQLHHELLDHLVVHDDLLTSKARAFGQGLASTALAHRQGFHVFLHIEVEELHDQVQLMTIGVHDVEEADDIGVVHLFEKGNLADGGRWHAFIFGFEADFLEGDNALVLCGEISRFVHDSIST